MQLAIPARLEPAVRTRLKNTRAQQAQTLFLIMLVLLNATPMIPPVEHRVDHREISVCAFCLVDPWVRRSAHWTQLLAKRPSCKIGSG